MRYLITGVAGFIGSHLAERLLDAGHSVVGLDSFVPYYPRPIKERNLRALDGRAGYTFHEADLRDADLAPLLDGVEVVYHIAAMAGLLKSWTEFDLYVSCNINATHRLLEAAVAARVSQFIHASTSSIYGKYVIGPEDSLPQPISPYGITKLAAEHLVTTFHHQFGLPTTILRFFSVYGPRQRPDMGYQIFVDKVLRGEEITIFGDGSQTRANTYVDDIVNGAVLASQKFQPGQVYNLGGTEEVSVIDVIRLVEELTGEEAAITFGPPRPGEQSRAVADITRAHEQLGYQPSTSLRDGLSAQVAWHRAWLESEGLL